MRSNIPLPTDNIYKFYALFGLLLFITVVASTLYVSKSTNELIFASAIEIEAVNALEKPSLIEKTKKEIAEKRVELAISDKNFFIKALGGMAGIACMFMGYGFFKWHNEVQPMQDKLLKLQIEKAERENVKVPRKFVRPQKTS